MVHSVHHNVDAEVDVDVDADADAEGSVGSPEDGTRDNWPGRSSLRHDPSILR